MLNLHELIVSYARTSAGVTVFFWPLLVALYCEVFYISGTTGGPIIPRSRSYEGFTRLRPRALDRVLHSGTFVVELT